MIGVSPLNVRSALTHTCVLGWMLFAWPASAPAALDETAARTRAAELRAAIAHHDALYFRDAAPEISDAAYDALRRELAELERSFPVVAVPLPTGDDRTGAFPPHRHGAPMLSLEKGHSEAELRAWHAALVRRLGDPHAVFVVEPKIDGLAASVTYEHGRLATIATRGDGTTGDDLTANARAIANLPAALAATRGRPPPARLELRGEIHVPWAEFRRLNDELESFGEPGFAHPRNLAVGLIRRRDGDAPAAGGLRIVFHGWGDCAPPASSPAGERELLEQLRAWALPAVPEAVTARTADEIWAAVQHLAARRPTLPYPIDGAVVKLDSAAARAVLGESPTAPRWAIAYKFPAERTATLLRGITWQVGRTGRLTPVAELAPVTLAGSTITRATLANTATVARLGLLAGDQVFLEKAGEIIPQITGVDAARRPPAAAPLAPPQDCPSCTTALAVDASSSDRSCPNRRCPAQVRGRLAWFASKAGVGIAGLGPATVETLVARGLVGEPADLYRLRRADLVALPRFGAARADTLLAAIARSRRVELWRLIAGLGLPRVGPGGARRLASAFPDLASLADADPARLRAALGDAAGEAVAAELRSPATRTELLHLAAEIESQSP